MGVTCYMGLVEARGEKRQQLVHHHHRCFRPLFERNHTVIEIQIQIQIQEAHFLKEPYRYRNMNTNTRDVNNWSTTTIASDRFLKGTISSSKDAWSSAQSMWQVECFVHWTNWSGLCQLFSTKPNTKRNARTPPPLDWWKQRRLHASLSIADATDDFIFPLFNIECWCN